MVQSIEAFVAKLQEEGVEAGQKAAEQLCAQAKQQADDMVKHAQAEAESIIAQAKAEAERTVERSKTDLQLAVRDATMQLRETLNRALSSVLAGPVEETLKDTEFLKSLIRELVLEYAKTDIEGTVTVELHVSPEMQTRLANWAIQELREAAAGKDVRINLKDRLRQAGFEYSISGGTVEVTQESVVETLKGMVGPHLREVFDKAAAG